MAAAQQDVSQKPDNTVTAVTGQSSGPADEVTICDEERLEDAMETLKEMHIQLRNLRTTIPRLIAPLAVKQPSPDDLLREYGNASNTANQEVQAFRKLMNDPKSQKVLEQARKSCAQNPSSIKPWKVTDHPDWLTKKVKEKPQNGVN